MEDEIRNLLKKLKMLSVDEQIKFYYMCYGALYIVKNQKQEPKPHYRKQED